MDEKFLLAWLRRLFLFLKIDKQHMIFTTRELKPVRIRNPRGSGSDAVRPRVRVRTDHFIHGFLISIYP